MTRMRDLLSTTRHDPNATLTFHGSRRQEDGPSELVAPYLELVSKRALNWTTHHRLGKLLGCGGQGRVFLSACRGTDDFTVPVAVKVFSPQRYPDVRQYEEAMRRIAGIAARVSVIQHDNLLDVHNFVDRNRIRIMVMEWIDGFDLRKLMQHRQLTELHAKLEARRWRGLHVLVVALDCRGRGIGHLLRLRSAVQRASSHRSNASSVCGAGGAAEAGKTSG